MKRADAIRVVAESEFSMLSVDKREAKFLTVWPLTADDPFFDALPNSIQTQMLELEDPPPYDSNLAPLVIQAIETDYLGVTNEYLRERIAKCGFEEEVIGNPEEMTRCPCCRFYSLKVPSDYRVCPVCYWENDGVMFDSQKSPANRMTLAEAKTNFLKIGAVENSFLKFIAKDIKLRYAS